jgi:nucleotide-binding universal stress UspA family protein
MGKLLYIVAVDGSEWGERAAERAINLAQKTHAKVQFLTVMDWSYLQPQSIEGMSMPIPDKETEERLKIDQVLTPLVKKYSDTQVEITTELLLGDAVTEILKQVKEMHANMIFVGRQGRSRVVDILLGSVANKLAHRAGIPIVLVP